VALHHPRPQTRREALRHPVLAGQHHPVRHRGGGGVYTLPPAVGFLVAIGGSNLAVFFQADRYLRFVLFMGWRSG